MRFSLYALLLIFCISYRSQDQLAEEHRFLASGFSSTTEAGAFLNNVSDEKLKDYMFHDDLKIAIPAAWVNCKRSCNQSSKTDEQMRYRGEFVGYLAGRLRSEIPVWWTKEILTIETSHKFNPPKLDKHSNFFSNTVGVTHVNRIAIDSLSDSLITGKVEGVEFVLNWDRRKTPIAKKLVSGLGAFAVVSLNDGRIIWAITSKPQSDFLVYCTGTDNDKFGKEIWRSTIFRADHMLIGGKGGYANGYLEVTTDNDTVYFFGANEAAIFLDAFDLITGVPKLRFTTNF